MATKNVIIPVRVTKADRDLLKRMAPGGSVSAWLRDLAIAATRKRRAVVDVARLLDAAKADGDMTDEEVAELAAEAKREVRSRRRAPPTSWRRSAGPDRQSGALHGGGVSHSAARTG